MLKKALIALAVLLDALPMEDEDFGSAQRGALGVAAAQVALAGACSGFLPWNFPRARIFLGDTGSQFLGMMMASLALLENNKGTAAITLLLWAVGREKVMASRTGS